MRAGRVTASVCRAVCHTNLQKPSMPLLMKVVYPEKLVFVNDATRWGIDNEPKARKQYTELMEKTHTEFSCSLSGFNLHTEKSIVGCSPDGYISYKCCGLGTLEIKCPYSVKECIDGEDFRKKVKYLEKVVISGNPCVSLDKDHEFYYQVQCQMYATKRSFGDFYVWCPLRDVFHLERINADPQFVEEMVFRCMDYFYRVVLPEVLGKFWTRTNAKGVRAPRKPRKNAKGKKAVQGRAHPVITTVPAPPLPFRSQMLSSHPLTAFVQSQDQWHRRGRSQELSSHLRNTLVQSQDQWHRRGRSQELSSHPRKALV